ncbi:unnamed protein product, partial [marine sediment metagenome]
MNNYKVIGLTHWQSASGATARFRDGSDNARRYPNVTPESIERLQNAIRQAVDRNEFVVRLPRG